MAWAASSRRPRPAAAPRTPRHESRSPHIASPVTLAPKGKNPLEVTPRRLWQGPRPGEAKGLLDRPPGPSRCRSSAARSSGAAQRHLEGVRARPRLPREAAAQVVHDHVVEDHGLAVALDPVEHRQELEGLAPRGRSPLASPGPGPPRGSLPARRCRRGSTSGPAERRLPAPDEERRGRPPPRRPRHPPRGRPGSRGRPGAPPSAARARERLSPPPGETPQVARGPGEGVQAGQRREGTPWARGPPAGTRGRCRAR